MHTHTPKLIIDISVPSEELQIPQYKASHNFPVCTEAPLRNRRMLQLPYSVVTDKHITPELRPHES